MTTSSELLHFLLMFSLKLLRLLLYGLVPLLLQRRLQPLLIPLIARAGGCIVRGRLYLVDWLHVAHHILELLQLLPVLMVASSVYVRPTFCRGDIVRTIH